MVAKIQLAKILLWTVGGGKHLFLKTSGRYHKLVSSHHKGISKLHPAQV